MPAAALLLLVGRWSKPGPSFEQPRERRDAGEAQRIANIGYASFFFQQQPGFPDPHMGQVLVWRMAIDIFEQPYKMKAGKMSFVGNIIQVGIIGVMRIDKQLRL